MLQTQIVSVSLAQGLDTKTDPKQVQGDYLLIQNAIYQTLQQLNPRSGFTALSNTTYTIGNIGSLTAGFGLAALDNALLQHDGTNVWTRNNDLNQWDYVGQKQAVTVSSQGVGSSSSAYFTSVGSCRASNGVELYVWIDRTINISTVNSFAGTAYFLAYDTSNNVAIYQPFGVVTGIISTGITSIRCDVVGSNFFITTSNGTEIDIYKQPITAPNFTTAIATVVDAAANINFIDTCTSSSAIYILGNKVYKVVASSLVVTSSVASNYGPVPDAGINFDAALSNVWICTIFETFVEVAVLDANLTVVKALTTVYTLPGNPTGGAVSLTVDNNLCYILCPLDVYNSQVALSVTLSGGSYTTLSSLLNATSEACSKPMLRADGFLYYVGIFVSFSSQTTNPIQPTSFLLKFDPTTIGASSIIPTVVAKSLPLETGIPYGFEDVAGVQTPYFLAPNALIVIDSNNITFPNLQTTQDVIGFGNKVVPSSIVVRSQFQFLTKFHRGLLANNIHTSGGYISAYDKAQEVELGFHLFPELTGSSQGAHSPGVQAGTFIYSAIFRWIDAQGNINRSAPAVPLTVVVGSNNQAVTLQVKGITLTDKNTYYLDLYRSQNGGTVLYFLQSVLFGKNAVSLNGTLVDTNPNDQVSTIELYTTGGEVDNIPSPATSFMVDFKNRLFSIPSENPYQLWYTKQVLPNFPAEFSDLFTIQLEARGGPATALAPLDDKLIIFKKNAIFYMVGDGPSPSGANNDFSYPQIVPSDSGCLEPDSVVGFPGGVCYKGSKGIYLLDRSMQVEYIGAPVEAYNQYSITSAKLDYNLNLIRYTLSNGISIVYDYFVKKWSTFTNISAVDSDVGNGVYYYLQADGTVEQETPGTYNDNGALISMGFTSGWLSFAKVQGFERVKALLLLGKNTSPSTLSVGFAYDFDPTIVQTSLITNSISQDPWQWRVFLDRQKCETVQLTFSITPTTPVGKGLSLSAIALEVGVKRGLYKLPASQSTS